MELPFKYIVLSMIKMLDERELPLVIKRSAVMNFIVEILKKGYFTVEEKREMSQNFDFDYEIDDLVYKYLKYFDISGDEIIFDSDYIDELDELIKKEVDESDIVLIHDIDFVIETETVFLNILGVKIRKELYNYLLQIEKEIEVCYGCFFKEKISLNDGVNSDVVVKKLKNLYMKRCILLLNAKNLLSYNERNDLANYASNVVDDVIDFDEFSFLLDDEKYGEEDVIYNVFFKSIFTGSVSYHSILREKLNLDVIDVNDNMKYSKIKFYLTFMILLDREIKASSGIVNMEFLKVKYRLMNVLDSVYDMTLFINEKKEINADFKEEYYFFQDSVYYFINELLMYDDEKYRNGHFNIKNEMIYVTNILKKLIIETYYSLTKEKEIVHSITSNPLYGVNSVSSSLLKNVVDNPKKKIK